MTVKQPFLTAAAVSSPKICEKAQLLLDFFDMLYFTDYIGIPRGHGRP